MLEKICYSNYLHFLTLFGTLGALMCTAGYIRTRFTFQFIWTPVPWLVQAGGEGVTVRPLETLALPANSFKTFLLVLTHRQYSHQAVAALAVFEGQRFLFIASTSDGESLVDSPTY